MESGYRGDRRQAGVRIASPLPSSARLARCGAVTSFGKIAASLAALLIADAVASVAARSQSSATVVEFESPLAAAPPLQGLLRQPNGAQAAPAVVLLHAFDDDWTLAKECRNMVEGRDDYGISRQSGDGVPMRLVVYPGAAHAFDVPALRNPVQLLGHRLQFDQAAADHADAALREFLNEQIGE